MVSLDSVRSGGACKACQYLSMYNRLRIAYVVFVHGTVIYIYIFSFCLLLRLRSIIALRILCLPIPQVAAHRFKVILRLEAELLLR